MNELNSTFPRTASPKYRGKPLDLSMGRKAVGETNNYTMSTL